MPEEDQPSELIYAHDQKLTAHFDEVKRRHKERFKTSRTDEDLEEVPQTENEEAARVKEALGL